MKISPIEIKLSEERWKLVIDNIELVNKILYFLSPKLKNIDRDIDEYNEAGMEGLISAAYNFDFNKSTAKFSTYAITCIRREIIKKYRKNAQLKSRFSSKDLFQEIFCGSEETLCSNEISVLENLENQEQIKELKELLKNLPEKERKIIILYVLENKTYSQIGKIFNVSGEMVRVYIKNILKKLKNKLGVLA